MRKSDARQQLVSERQVLDALHLVDNDDDGTLGLPENDLTVELVKTLPVAKERLVLPPRLQLEANSELAQDAVGNAVVEPTGICAGIPEGELLEIENGDLGTVVLQPLGSCCDEARLAGLIRSNDVTMPAREQGLVEELVGWPPNVTGANRVQGRTNRKELPGGLRRLAAVLTRLSVLRFAHTLETVPGSDADGRPFSTFCARCTRDEVLPGPLT